MGWLVGGTTTGRGDEGGDEGGTGREDDNDANNANDTQRHPTTPNDTQRPQRHATCLQPLDDGRAGADDDGEGGTTTLPLPMLPRHDDTTPTHAATS